MNAKAQKFKIDPAKEVIAMMVRLARSGIDPGETLPQAVRRFLTHSYDVNYDGEVVSRLKRHDE
jgi:hypothetical protein